MSVEKGPSGKISNYAWYLGYQGSFEIFHCIHPIKDPLILILTAHEEIDNKELSSDRIIVENYFGRYCSIWDIFHMKYRWKEDILENTLCFFAVDQLADYSSSVTKRRLRFLSTI